MENSSARQRTYSWGDPMQGATEAKTLSGIDYLRQMEQGSLPLPPLMHTLDFKVEVDGDKKVVFSFIPQEFHYNPIGCVHGGVITAILDSVMGCTLHVQLPAGTGYTTLDLKVNFLRAVTIKSGELKATATIIHKGSRTALLEASLADATGTIYAHGTSTCLILKP